MYKPSTCLVVIYFHTYVPIYKTYLLQNRLPRWNHILTQLGFIHNRVPNNRHPVDGVLVGWFTGTPFLRASTKSLYLTQEMSNLDNSENVILVFQWDIYNVLKAWVFCLFGGFFFRLPWYQYKCWVHPRKVVFHYLHQFPNISHRLCGF
jgi:hypothetical protein